MKRIISKFIDLGILFTLAAAVFYPLGPLLALAYSLYSDALPFWGRSGQSIGKKLTNLQVVSTLDGRPISYRQSFLRNIPVGLATMFALIPLWGWFILIIVGIPLFLMEVYLMKKAEGGRRLGDVLGDTEVRELKALEKTL